MNKPNFLLIGAPKSGTTSLYNYLNQHPQVFMSTNKEPKFFAFEGCNLDFNGHHKGIQQIKESTITNYSDYLNLFKDANTYKVIGEASPIYLHHTKAPKNIKKYLPNVKLVAILRNPIERLYSDWKHQVRMGWEPERDFFKALKQWELRENQNWIPYLNYLPKGLYYKNLSRYFQLFDNKQIKIVLYEDLKNDASKLMQELFDFLEIDQNVVIDTSHCYMKSNPIPKNYFIEKIILKINKKMQKIDKLSSIRGKIIQLNKIDETLPVRYKNEIFRIYQEDILKLQKIIHRDLSSWLI